MNLRENRRANLVSHLQRKGFRVGSNLVDRGNRAVSIPAFGLCSYAAAYCVGEDLIPQVAEALIDEPGVDFCVYRDGSDVVINGHRGSARIEKRVANGDTLYRYAATSGDPLNLDQLTESLRAARRLDANGFGHDSTWFEQTNSHDYPDALSNIHASLWRDRVKHTADVLISLRDGYYFGWSPFGHMIRLAATHGNAQSPSSNAFMMSTHRELPECVRADNARTLLRDD
jgi:hypothetical protein